MKKSRGWIANSALALEELGEKEWRITEIPYEVEMTFNELLEARDFGDMPSVEMEQQLRKLLYEHPNFIDVYHHLAMLLDERGKKQEARLLWEQAVNIGMQCFIERFTAGGNRLEWGWIENRPFLRAYHALGLQHLRSGRVEMALSIFRTILALNPVDNQGVRALAVECCLRLERYKDALSICEDCPDDFMAETVYGRVMALFCLKRQTQAEKALRRAVDTLPLVARELVKKRHIRPKTLREGRYSVGGADQAYLYWEDAGDLWEKVPGAIDFVRDVLERDKLKGKGE